ncbi:hybrid sensor histidine kinase/response regulator [Massilia eurypsychrophila]|uniref:histidine kinase n=1 Tax=Massilia eurypsychrophila TaxID=1485217 RepID=A0A2G8TCL1_9BURK|nr:ATP-binding protein [Massilia eurypsychrophila]PIL43770.1 hybrid sensor histidine kinase/response regulator [Massilia eurypsychrophila]
MYFRNRLLVLVLSILLPAFASSMLAVWYVYDQEHDSQERSVGEAARALALLVNKELQAREGVLLALASSPALARGDLAEFHAHAKLLAPTPGTAIILQEPSGIQLMNTRVPAGEPLPLQSASNMGKLIDQYGGNRTLVSDVFLASVAKRYDFAIQVPVLREGEIKYYLAMGIQAASLQSLFQNQRFPQSWIITVIDRTGKVVARTRDDDKFIGTTVRTVTQRVIGASAEGSFASITLDGIAVKAFFSTIERADWKMLISIPEAEIRQIPVRAAALLGAMLVLVLLLALAAARRTSRSTILPIEHLGTVADRLGRGEPVRYQSQGLLEIDRVGLRLADAADQITTAQSELERRIAVAVANNERAQVALIKGQKLEALSRLTGGIAHDFNNLLQTLTSALQLAAMTADPDRVQSLLATCQAAVRKATDLTAQLGSFGKVQDARLEVVELGPTIRKKMQLLASAVGSSVSVRLDLADRLWPVRIDPVQLDLALVNIALNACDAMPQGGALRIGAENVPAERAPRELPGEYVLLRVTDTGIGMSPEVLANALDPFFTTKPMGQANGLGLAQVYGFATNSGGLLRLDSVEGEGTTVELYLPRAAVSSGVEPSAGAPLPAPVPAARHVLFVDDDSLLRETVAPALEHAGFTVTVAASGDEALAFLQDGLRPDIVFSDIVMPGRTNGIDLAKIVRERYAGTGIVLATGYSLKRTGLPDVQVLSKPYELRAVIDALTASFPKESV